jgi:LAO/AO transport system kinase
MVDTFVLVALPGSGDEIQGIKRGIVEIAHVVVVNKADGDNVARAEIQARELSSALSCVASRGPGTDHEVPTVSAVTGRGMDAFVAKLDHHHAELVRTGELARVRADQTRHAIVARAEEEAVALLDAFLRDHAGDVDALTKDVAAGRTTSGRGASALLARFRGS